MAPEQPEATSDDAARRPVAVGRRGAVILVVAVVGAALVGAAWDALRGPDRPVLTAEERAHLDEVAEEIDCQLDDGCLRWARELDEAWRDPPSLARAGDVAAVLYDEQLTGWDIATGEQRWELDVEAPDDRSDTGAATQIELHELGEGRVVLWTGEQVWVVDDEGSVLARLTMPMLPLLHLDGDELRVATPALPVRPPDDDDPMPEARGEVGVYELGEQDWRWRRELDVASLDPLVVVDGSTVAALDPASGRARWSVEESFAAVTALEEAVAIGLPDGGVEVRAIDSGEIRNRVPGHLRPVQRATSGMPALSPRLTLAVDEERWRAIGADGEVHWQRQRPAPPAGAEDDGEGDAPPLAPVDVGHDLLLVGGQDTDDESWRLLELDTGRMAARVPDGASPSMGFMGSVTMASPTVMVSSGSGPAAAHDLAEERELWRTRGSRGDVAVSRDLGIVVTSDPTGLIALELD